LFITEDSRAVSTPVPNAAPHTPPLAKWLSSPAIWSVRPDFVGDLHQPLHAADNQDRGGNCVPLALGGPRTVNLHSYWDTVAVEAIEPDPIKLATKLSAEITPADLKAWRKGDTKAWAWESYAVAKSAVYTIGSKPGCASDAAPIALPAGYDAAAQAAVALQLKKAGVRLALELNRALDPSSAH